jgi:hypothetical protein
MSFNDIGWLLAFALATLTIFQLAHAWADRKFKFVHERIDAADKWFHEEIKSTRSQMNRTCDDLYTEMERLHERVDACTPADKKEKSYYNSDAGCCKSKQFVQD